MNINVDLDVSEVYWELSRREKKEFVEMLAEDGLCIDLTDKSNDKLINNLLDEMWNEEVTKLINCRHLLTTEQELQILQITKKI